MAKVLLGDIYYEKKSYRNALISYKKAFNYTLIKDKNYYYKDEIAKINYISFHKLYELSLIHNMSIKSKLEKSYIRNFKHKKKVLIIYEMLKMFKDVFNQNSRVLYGWDIVMDDWKTSYEDYNLNEWDFDRLSKWVENIKDEDMKDELVEMLKIFKEHKK